MTRLRSFLLAGALAAPFLTIPGRGAGHVSAIGSIAGTVTGATGAPLAGATIIVTRTGSQAVSGTRGEYRISGVTTGKVEVVARLLGFRPQKRTVEVKESLVARADFALIPEPGWCSPPRPVIARTSSSTPSSDCRPEGRRPAPKESVWRMRRR